MFQDNREWIRLPRLAAERLISAISVLILLAVAASLLIPREVLSNRVDVSYFPLLNASLNGASGVFLAAGYVFIRRRQVERHRFCMISAAGLSALFLVSYLIYHAVAGSTRFTGSDWTRPIYFTLLILHIIFAALMVPMALTTLYRAWRSRFHQHRRIARWTLPLWLFVSASGVVLYFMLYHLPK